MTKETEEPNGKHKDKPWDENLRDMLMYWRAGHDVYQKVTCAGCGQRLTIEEPGVVYRTIRCDGDESKPGCGHITDCTKVGGGFMLVMRSEI